MFKSELEIVQSLHQQEESCLTTCCPKFLGSLSSEMMQECGSSFTFSAQIVTSPSVSLLCDKKKQEIINSDETEKGLSCKNGVAASSGVTNIHPSQQSLSLAMSCKEDFNPDPFLSFQYTSVVELARRFNKFYLTGGFKKCRPFLIEGRQVGLLLPSVVEAVKNHQDVFHVDNNYVALRNVFRNYLSRSLAVDKVLRQWKEDAQFATLKGWREECYEVRGAFAEAPFMKMERAATCLFGLRQFGVDINGYVRHPERGLCLWLQRRSRTKQTWPGKLDNMVGGGLSVGHSVLETAMKEAEEEASVPPELIKHLKSVGSVSLFFESERGIFPNTEFVFDLELPPSFVPKNADGEVESFELVPVSDVISVILSPEFKTTSCPVTLDFLVRHGYITHENEPSYPELVELLHMPLHLMYTYREETP